jgi:hypothetical protein
VSSLEDIAIFTDKEDVPLSKVFDLIHDKEKGGTAIEGKSDGVKLRNWFEEVLPDYDKDKVYTSDIKKIAVWYNILHKLGLLVKETVEAEPAEEEVSEPVKKEKAATRKKKKAADPGSEK